MLQPRETDIPALILVLVVLPLVTYILLGQWSEAAKKKEKISLFAQLAAEEAFKAEAMATATVIPLVPSSKNGIHECARCCGPATTRCARCKSVWYCSGRCQIIHWRQVHKQDCQQLEYNSNNSSPMSSSNKEFIHERDLLDDLESRCFRYNIKQPRHEKIPSDDIIHPASATAACMTMDTSGVLMMERRSIDKKVSRKSKRESSKREDGAIVESSEEASRHRATCSTSSNITPSKEAYMRHKFKESESMSSKEEIPEKNFNILSGNSNGHATSRSSMHGKSHKSQNQKDLIDGETEIIDGGSLLRDGITSNDETKELNCSLERTSMKKNNKAKSASHSLETNMYKSPKTAVKASREQSCSDKDRTGQIADESKFARIRDTIHAQGGNGVASMGIMKMIGLMRSSKPDRLDCSEVNGFRHKKIKMLFPYEEFVKLFRFEVFDLSPRGLVNCGNSCYANAVLQCLICTKPLTIYLLRRSHSRSCCVRDWCLICELEQHVMMLRENGGPLSPNGILLHMRSINCQIGDGSQEDAHEFLRLLVTSMQSICLEGLGGENVVDLRLQETTFIQHTFGGRLRSKVKCLRCHHESEQYENIMDLTLEIFGWVESLEDALTQFTSTEDLDGENMYRCGRCAAYVRARKQLSIQEAPNILTIVLKRFQEGSYGKINKCITFPDMLDMIPFMCGTDDIPPLYMLYAVVVHLDTLNASFSGHYISYVKDLQGNWFRIDDSQVQPVPMSQVMSEGAYILFYMRSCPRPARSCTGKPARHQDPGFAKQWAPKTPKRLRSEQSKTSLTRNSPQMMEGYGESRSMEFSDATSSDCSIFTCSDDASFTTESTRDSFSTVDYADACNIDPFSSIFNTTLYTPDYSSHKTVSCSRFSSSKPQTRFVSEGKNSIMDSYLSSQSLDGFKNLKQGNVPSAGAFPPGSHCGVHVKYQSNPKGGTLRTSGNCKL